MSDFALSTIQSATDALFQKDYQQAERAIKDTIEIHKKEEEVFDILETNKNKLESYRIRRIVENVRRIAEYASDIGEIVLNMNIEKEVILEPKSKTKNF